MCLFAALVRAVEKKETRKEAVDFFKDEYTLDREIALMKKPVISFMDGATSMSENVKVILFRFIL